MNLAQFDFFCKAFPVVIAYSSALTGTRSSGVVSAFLAQTPVGNTGSKCQYSPKPLSDGLYLSIDWLTFSLPIVDLECVLNAVQEACDLFKDSIVWSEDKGFTVGKYYESSARGARGALFTWNMPSGDTPGSLRVSLPSSTLSEARQDTIWAYIRSLIEQSAVFSRFDVAIDDYAKAIEPQQIMDAYGRGDYGRFRTFRPVCEYNLGKMTGWTLYMGSRESESFLRYYDKSAESSGRLDCYRLEAEFKGDKAAKVAFELSCIPLSELHSIAPKYLSAVVLGCCEFADRKGRTLRLSRACRLPWWQDFIDRVGESLRVVVRRTPSTFRETRDWVVRAVMPSITALRDYYDRLGLKHYFDSWFESELIAAEKRRTPRQEARIQASVLGSLLDLNSDFDNADILAIVC